MAQSDYAQHSRAYVLAVAAFMGIFMFGYDTVRLPLGFTDCG